MLFMFFFFLGAGGGGGGVVLKQIGQPTNPRTPQGDPAQDSGVRRYGENLGSPSGTLFPFLLVQGFRV